MQPEMKEITVSLLREKSFDIIHVETFYVMQNLPKTYLPIVLAEHNIEYQVYGKYVNTAPLPLRPFLLADIAKIKYWEKKFWRKATKLIAVSESDKKEMGREDIAVVPNGVDLDKFKLQSYKLKVSMKEKRILFIGDFKWLQNKEAANWILDEIWPNIQKMINDKSLPALPRRQAGGRQGLRINLKLWIVGKNIPENIKSQKSKSILIDEDAPNETAKIYQKSFVLLAPITIGGGTSYKILEAMASGVPVVTTDLGVKGLGATHNKEALVGSSASMLTQQVMSLVEDKNKYTKIQKEARRLIEENYSWTKIAEILENVYESALNL